MANVTFEPGCRNNWHIHRAKKGGGQMLICTAGEGWYQEWGEEPQSLVPGTVVVISPNVRVTIPIRTRSNVQKTHIYFVKAAYNMSYIISPLFLVSAHFLRI